MRALALSFLLLSACSTTIAVRDFSAGSASYNAVKGKRVAVVNDPARIQDNHGNWSDGHKFNFTEVRPAVAGAVQRRLAPAASGVKIVSPEAYASAKGSYDVAVFPSVKVRVVNDFWTKGCLVNFGMTIERDGRVVAEDSQEFKKSFFSLWDFQEACRSAFSSIVPIVTDRAMASAGGK